MKFVNGPFEYEDLQGGFIKILGNWKEENIEEVRLPIVNPQTKKYWTVECNKKISTVLFSIFLDYAKSGVEQHYPIKQLGCFCPRHKMSNPKRSLSLHSYGMAVDINWRTNPIGQRGDIPRELIKIFRKHGWTWGGSWRRPKDPMHFEFYSGS